MRRGLVTHRRSVGQAGLAAVSLLVVATALGGTATAASAASAPPQRDVARTHQCRPIFDKAFVADLGRRFPGQRVTASIQDVRTGCSYHLHRDLRLTTASMVKAQVLGAVLLKAQDEHRRLDARERHDIHPMIRWSYNDPYVPDLYDDVGGVAGMDRFDERMHADHTTNTLEFGATVTTAADRTNIARRMLYGGGPLRAAYRAVAWHYMSTVTPTQRWGITAGMRQGWTVALKNGFYPIPGHEWRAGSSGFLRAPHSHSGYAMTVMTDDDRTQADGIRLVQQVVRRVADALTTGPRATPIVDRSRCLTIRSGTNWTTVAHRLGTTDISGVRRVSGGNPDPLFGQRVCSPTLKPRASTRRP
jgi:beta-lactamase class A